MCNYTLGCKLPNLSVLIFNKINQQIFEIIDSTRKSVSFVLLQPNVVVSRYTVFFLPSRNFRKKRMHYYSLALLSVYVATNLCNVTVVIAMVTF